MKKVILMGLGCLVVGASSCTHSGSRESSASHLATPQVVKFRESARWEPVDIGLMGASPEDVAKRLGREQDVSGMRHAATYMADGVSYMVEFQSNRVVRTFKGTLEPLGSPREQQGGGYSSPAARSSKPTP